MSVLEDIAGTAVDGSRKSLHELYRPGKYSLIWWHPQVLAPVSCKSCSKEPTEPINLLREIYDAGANIVGLTYESPERAQKYLRDIGLVYPILSVTADEARAHGVAKVEGEPWQSIPHRIAFLVNDHGEVINRYEVDNPVHFLRVVRDDVRNGASTETVVRKRKKLLGIF